MADLFKYEEENLFKFEDGGDLFKYEDQPKSQFKLDANQPVTGTLKNFVPEYQPLVRESNVFNTKPMQAEMVNSRGFTPMDLRTKQPIPTQQMETGMAAKTALVSGAKQMAGGLAEAFAVNPNMAAWGQDVQAQGNLDAMRANIGNDKRSFLEKGVVGAAQSAVPMGATLAGGLLGGMPGYLIGGTVPMFGQVYSGTEGTPGTRMTSATLQTAIEQGLDIPEAVVLFASKLPAGVRVPLALAINWFTELGEEGLQKAASVIVEERRIPSSDEIANEIKDAIPAVTVMTGLMGAPSMVMGQSALPSKEQIFNQALQGEIQRGKPNVFAPIISKAIEANKQKTVQEVKQEFENASQIQGPSSGMLRQERPQMGLQENGGTYAQPQEATREGQAQEDVTNTVKGAMSNGLASDVDQEIMAILGDLLAQQEVMYSQDGSNALMPSIGTGKGMTTNEVVTAITNKFGKKAGKLINEGRLRIVQSASDLPEWGRNQKGIGGAWDGKTAWIVADSMNPNKVIGAYLHEVGEHAGMRGIMGDNYQQLINRFNELLQEGDAIAVKADSRVPKDTRAGDVAQERIAYFIEEATKAQQANTLSEKAIRLLKDIIAAMRAWAYRKFGGVKLNADDFVALAKHAANVWADTPTQEKVDSPMFTKEDVDELSKKFAFAIKGQADSRIQSSAEKAFLDNQAMFERMKRGVVSVKDSEAAGDLLAKEVGWSPESIDQFIKDAGTQGVPPVEILAATMAMSRMQSLKLLEAQDPAEFLDYTADVLNTLMATRAYGSEMGRALQFIGAMERKGGYTPEQAKAQIPTAKKQAKQTADKAFEILKDKSVSHEDMKKALGGDKGIKKIMEAIKAQGKDIDLGMLVQYLSGVADGIVKAQKEDTTKVNSLMNMAMELFQANILTGIFTHEVNITSNLANMLMEFAFIQPVKGLVGGKKGLAGTAAGYKMLGGYKQLLSDIWALMKYNAFEELPASRLSHLLAQRDPTMIALMRGSEGSKWNDTKRKYIPGKAGKIIRGYGFVPLGVEDAIFKVIPFRFELARQQGAGEAQDIAKAIRFAEEMTFQSKSEFAATVSRFTSKHPSTKPWLLFIKTMTNIMKRITELTPVAGQVYNKKELLGLEGKDAQQAAVARMIVGWSLAAMLWGLIDDGEDDGEIGIIGYGPSERRKEALWKKAGNEQVALRVGEDLYPFYRLDPVAGFIGLVAAEKKAATYTEAEKYDDAMVEIANGFYQAIMSKHFMVNVEETIGLMQDLIRYQKPQEEIEDEGKYKAPTPLDRVRRSIAKMGMSMAIPNIIPQMGDLTDEQKRKTRTIEDDLLRKFPVLREKLPEMLDVSGQPMDEPRYHSPFPVNKKHAPRDEVSRWMMKLGRTLESDPVRLRGLDKDVRKELLQRRWDNVTLAYELSKDMPKDIQKDNLESALRSWSRESGRIVMMEELNKE